VNDIRAIRRALNLRLTDVAGAVGITATRLSLAERGMTRLSHLEQRAVEKFLRSRLASEIGTGEAE
jgi:transcriptional regulator with XRE-family HTH domain